MLHSEPIHLASGLVADLLEQVLAQQLVPQRLDHARFDFIPVNGELVRARPLVAGAEATEAIRGAGANNAALGQSENR